MLKDRSEAERIDRKNKEWEEREFNRIDRQAMLSALHDTKVSTHKRNLTEQMNNRESQLSNKLNRIDNHIKDLNEKQQEASKKKTLGRELSVQMALLNDKLIQDDKKNRFMNSIDKKQKRLADRETEH